MRGTTSQTINTAQLATLCYLCLFVGIANSQQENSAESRKQTTEPVFRVPKILPKATRPRNQKDPSGKIVPDKAINRVDQEIVRRRNTDIQVAPQTLPYSEPPVARVADAREINPAIEKKAESLVPEVVVANPSTATAHPLDRAVELARNSLLDMRENVADYTAIMVKRERVADVLGEPNYMRIKIRNPRTSNDQKVPFSIYMKFIKPRSSAGREVVWVEGQNNNKLIAHETSPLLKFKNFHLDPNGFLAMKGNKYPIYDAGLENLVIKLIEKAERDRAAGHCEVNYTDGAQINKRPCSVIEVVHRQKRTPYEFHIAKVYIDDELQIPVRFVSYDWPIAGGKPKIIEEYTYINVKVNVGLADSDFNIKNPAYNFAR